MGSRIGGLVFSTLTAIGSLSVAGNGGFGQQVGTRQNPCDPQTMISHEPSADRSASLEAQAKHFDWSVSAPEHSLRLDALSDEPRYSFALALLKSGKTHRAVTELRLILDNSPGLVEARNVLATALEQLGKLDEAEAEYRTALRLEPSSVYALHQLGQLLMECGRYRAAIAYVKRAAALEPRHVHHQLALAAAYAEDGQSEQALQILRSTVKANPRSFTACVNLGTLHARLQRYSEAAEVYQECLKIEPPSATTRRSLRLSLAKALLLIERNSEALDSLDAIEEVVQGQVLDFEVRYFR